MGQLLEDLWIPTFIRVILEGAFTVGLLDVVVTCSGIDTEEIAI
jgi:hypothetical protein